MKHFKRLLILIAIIAAVCVSCFSADTQKANNEIQLTDTTEQKLYYKEPQSVMINGRDYLMSSLPTGKFGGEFITSVIGEGPKTFNPWTSKDATSTEIGGLLYDGLLGTDVNTGEVIPNLAKSYEISADKKTYTIVLRKGLKWSDGKEITADDIVFTWNEIVKGGYGNTSLRDSVIIDGQFPLVEKTDKYTAKFTTIKPFAPFLRFLTEPIAPEHVFKHVLKKGKRYFDSYMDTTVNPKDMVTSGAFRLEEYVPAQRVVLKRYNDYYRINKDGQKLPYLDKYVLQIVGDLNNELLKFEAGELDIINVRGNDAARFKENESKGGYKMYNLGPNTGTMFLAFNMSKFKNEKGEYNVNPVKQKWFNDINFRTAVDYAVDKESEVANILNGVGEPLFTAEPLGSIFLNKKIAKGHKRNIRLAEEYLKKSGFYKDKNGKLYDKDGNFVEFDLYTNAGNTERESAGVMIKEDLSELGMKINFKPIEFNSLIGKLTGTLDWDTMIMGLTGSTLEPHGGKNVWNSNGPLHIFNQRTEENLGKNVLPFEEQIDEIFEKGAAELNFEKRKKYYDKYQQIIYDERPVVYLYSQLRLIAVRNRIGNVYPTVLGGAIHNIAEIYVK